MYYSRNVFILSDHPAYDYLSHISHCANDLYNAALFRERQLMSSSRKEVEDYSENEREIRNEFEQAVPRMKRVRAIPKSGFVSYAFLEEEMRVTRNPDYYAEGLPVQTAQSVIRHVCNNLRSFFEAQRTYTRDPSKFTARPQLPGYKHKGGLSSFDITNQDCVIRQNKKGHYAAKLPLTKETISLGKDIPGILKEVHVTPVNGRFQVSFVFDDGAAEPPCLNEKPERITAIDLGVDNLMAVTNNCGLENLLYKGGVIKSVNHNYNKRVADIVSKQTKGGTDKFIPTEEYNRVTNRRNDRIKDQLLKTGKHFITWCVENRIDTIVIGKNRFWKQGINIGKANNQKFVQIPFEQLRNILVWQASRHGIRVVEQEESYTSKASFTDNDEIPEYSEGENPSCVFKGKRVKRGLYQTGDGTLINADLNGAANILRKAFPGAFNTGIDPDFQNIRVIRHAEYEQRQINRAKQLQM